MKKKQVLAMSMALVMAMGTLSACGSSDSASTDAPAADTTADEEVTAETTEAGTEAADTEAADLPTPFFINKSNI